MGTGIKDALEERERLMGRRLTPEEFAEARREYEKEQVVARRRLLKDEDEHLDPMELLAQEQATVTVAPLVRGRRIKLPDECTASTEPTTVVADAPVVASTSAAAGERDETDASTSTLGTTQVRLNALDERLGNLSGTPRPASNRKNWDRRSNRTYRRGTITDRDLTVLAFLARFKFSNSTQLAALLDVKVNSAHRRLLGLQEVGLVGSDRVLGAKQLWRVTGKGMRLAESEDAIDEGESTYVRPGDVETSQLGHYLAVNQVAVQLLRGHHTWLGLAGVPSGHVASLSNFLTEYQIRSAWEQWKRTVATDGKGYDYYHRKVWEAQPSKVERPECWTLGREFGDKQANSYHHADLIYLPFGDDERGIAIEVEVSKKTVGDYKSALSSYLTNSAGFHQVAWVCGSKVIAERVQQAAVEVGLPPGFVTLSPLRTFDGEVFTGKAWRL